MDSVLNNINKSRYFNDQTANTKIDELKKQLDSDSDKDKLESMKKLIAMLSKGRDVSEAFPSVVKNVIAKNLELKKLVYMYLVHYAEIEHDSALLAINTIQKSLTDQSQVIRASALRVISSIRVVDIIQVIILAIEKSIKDSSPFVRKAAAFAIAKVHKLDQQEDKSEELIDLIEILLNDNSTMVLGATIVAFNEVCPDRFDLIHQHYRKICQLLADFDEWSQVITINLLTIYARTQFKCPDHHIFDNNKAVNGISNNNNNTPQKSRKPKSSSFYSDDEDQDEKGSKHGSDSFDNEEIDQDHRLLLKSSIPLLQSRNNAVVMAVSSLYFNCAPVIEAQKVGKSLVRLLHSNQEVQYIILTNISTMVTMRPNMFEPYLSEFFISSQDPEYCIKLKLEILTRLANTVNISRILKEFKEYIKNEDKKFVAATIQAIGSCASTIPDVTESCIFGLMSLLTNSSSIVVAESVIVLKRLLQLNLDAEKLRKQEKLQQQQQQQEQEQQEDEEEESNIKYENIIIHLSKLLDTLQVPSARASIIWVIGEYCHKIPMTAPDILRKLAKSFSDEHESVKQQTLNLAAKLHFLNNSGSGSGAQNQKQTEKVNLIFQYLLNQAKFDLNYDIRDTSRIMRFLLVNNEQTPTFSSYAKSLFITQKPQPTESSISEDRQRFTLGSLSHIVNHSAMGYQTLPDFPSQTSDPTLRQPKQKWVPDVQTQKLSFKNEYEPSFYSDEEEDEEDDDDEYDEDEENENEEEEEEEDELEAFFNDEDKKKSKKNNKKKQRKYDEDDDDNENQENMDEDELDELFGVSTDQQLSNEMHKLNINEDYQSTLQSVKKILLKPANSNGLSIEYCFIRGGSNSSNNNKKIEKIEEGEAEEEEEEEEEERIGFNNIKLIIKNTLSEETIDGIRISKKTLIDGSELIEFDEIESLQPLETVEKELRILFNSASQPAKFEITTNKGSYNVSLSPIIGELVIPLEFNDYQDWSDQFNQLESTTASEDNLEYGDSMLENQKNILSILLESINLQPIAISSDKNRLSFAGTTLLKHLPILMDLYMNPQNNSAKCTIRSSDCLVAMLLLKKVSDIIQK